MFVDRATIKLSAGKGGNGLVAWRREKYIPKGGPTGGNGGRGGDVVFVSEPQVYSLDWYCHKRLLRAEDGDSGGPNLRQGRGGKNLVLKVPCGTAIRDSVSGEILCDFTESGQRWLACSGGRGGRGNHSFRTPTRQAPNFATPGSPGESRQVELELKLIADIGLVGFPNAGKSTLFQALTAVPVKTAPYPFTTLVPHLSYIEAPDYNRLFIADIPGIIEGAHQNRGLGFEFLRHIERTSLLLIIVDASALEGRHPADDFRTLVEELSLYSSSLEKRPFLVALNKLDSEGAEQFAAEFREKYPYPQETLFEISALERTGLERLRHAIYRFFAIGVM